MSNTLRRSALVAAACLPLLVCGPALAAGLTFTSPVSGTTYLKKQDKTFEIPAGAYSTGELEGDTVTSSMTVPDVTSKVQLVDIPTVGDATATVRIVETRPSVLKLKADGSASGTSYFRIAIPALYSALLPGVNLVSPTCTSGEIVAPVVVPKFDLFQAFPATSTFTIPAFQKCGLAGLGTLDVRDSLISGELSGPDNVMNLMTGPGKLS